AAPVNFEIQIELEPQVELKGYTGIEVEVETHEVTDEQVDARIENMRLEASVLEDAGEDATLGPEDVAVLDVEVTGARGDRIPHLSHEGRTFYQWKRELPEPIADQLEGKRVGESVEAKIEEKTSNRRGEEVTFHDHWKVTVREIKRTRLPELDDEFAKDV